MRYFSIYRFIFSIITVMVIAIPSYGRRTVISSTTGKPIPYASIGFINKILGTVADSCGNFILKVPELTHGDTLKISCVGFTSRLFPYHELASLPDTIALDDAPVLIPEVIVKPQIIKSHTAGRRYGGGFIFIDLEGYKAAGQGLAVPLKVNKSAWLKEIGFTVVNDKNALSSMKFRVNVYRKEEGKYELDNIEPVYFDFNISDLDNDGHFAFKFPEEITLDKGEYYVELEFLQELRGII